MGGLPTSVKTSETGTSLKSLTCVLCSGALLASIKTSEDGVSLVSLTWNVCLIVPPLSIRTSAAGMSLALLTWERCSLMLSASIKTLVRGMYRALRHSNQIGAARFFPRRRGPLALELRRAAHRVGTAGPSEWPHLRRRKQPVHLGGRGRPPGDHRRRRLDDHRWRAGGFLRGCVRDYVANNRSQ